VAVHLALSRHMATPVIHADEFGYLMGARYLARGGLPTGMPYSPGYSVLLVPLWWLSDNAGTVYRWALDANAVLAGLTSLLLYRLGRRLFPESAPAVVAAGTAAVAAYPPLLLWSNLAQSENLLVPALVGLCLLLLRALEEPSPPRWVATGLVGGLLLAVHERTVVVGPILVLVALVHLRPWAARSRSLAAGTAALLVGLGAAEGLTRWVTRATPGYQLPSSGTTAGHLLSRLGTSAGLGHVLTELAGQDLYLMAAAGALAVAGVAVLIGYRPWSGSSPASGVAAFLLLAMVAEAGLAAVFLASGRRIDDAVYGRYVEAVAVPLFLCGAVGGPSLLRSTRRLRAVLGGGLAAVVVGALGVAAYWGLTLRGPVVMTNVLGVAELLRGTVATLPVLVLAGVALLAFLLVTYGLRASAAIGAALAVAVSVPAVAYGYSYLIDQSTGRLAQRALAAEVVAINQQVAPVACVAWDAASEDAWSFYNARLFAPAVRFRVFDSRRGQAPTCSSGLVAAAAGFSTLPAGRGAQLLVHQPSPAQLWVLPGPLQQALARHPVRPPTSPRA
jgi:hypothetical protein